jgi:hypothetical protein
MNRKLIRVMYCKQVLVSSIIIFILSFAIQVVVNIIASEMNLGSNIQGPSESTKSSIMFSVIIVPLVETLFNFTFLYYILFKLVKNNFIIIYTILGTFIFAINHCYSIRYILSTFALTYLWFLYFSILKRRNKNAFCIITIMHASRNLISYYFEYIIR